MPTPDFATLNREALLELFGGALSGPSTSAVQQPGVPAPGGYDAPVLVEAAPPQTPGVPPLPAERLKLPPTLGGMKPIPPTRPDAVRVKPSPFFRQGGR